ncbi:hypothetical protein F5Y10DRAFT_269919 [Nemania abortiva]|nr:hypothetical protein F5Y10DRAFT_269919 [Nemania abortiva]
MKFLLPASLLLAGSAHATFLTATAFNTTTTTTTTSTTSTSTTSTTTSATPTPVGYTIQCGGGLENLCGSLCFCGSGDVNCHADPSSRCRYMCNCIPQFAEKSRGYRWA